MSAFDSPAPTRKTIERDRWQRPLIRQPDGTTVGYTRTTTVARVLDDEYNLTKWKQRQVLKGMYARPDLALQIAAHYDEDRELDRIAATAAEAAKSLEPSEVGTALHRIAERSDNGEQGIRIPAEFIPDIAAYETITAGFKHLVIEQLLVCDRYRIAGTPDRISEVRIPGFEEADGVYIADLKTKRKPLTYGLGQFAIQLAIYANSELLDLETHERIPLPEGLNRERAIIIHLPAGHGAARLYWLDIAAGWEAVETAVKARDWQAFAGAKNGTNLIEQFGEYEYDKVAIALEKCNTVAELTQCWQHFRNDGWTSKHDEMSSSKASLLQATTEGV